MLRYRNRNVIAVAILRREPRRIVGVVKFMRVAKFRAKFEGSEVPSQVIELGVRSGCLEIKLNALTERWIVKLGKPVIVAIKAIVCTSRGWAYASLSSRGDSH